MSLPHRLCVLHVLDHSAPLHSGYSFRSQALLREQQRLGWRTVQLTSPKQGACERDEERVDGLLYHRTRCTVAAQSGALGLLCQMRATGARLQQLARAVRPDLIHAHSPVLCALPSLWVGRRLGLPVVYEMRASWEDAAVDHGSTHTDSLRYRASRALETLALRQAGHVIALCGGLRSDIAARGVPPSRITVVPNGVDPQAFAFALPPEPALRRALGLQDALVLGFAGSFYAYEGLALLLEVVARLRKRHAHLHVLLLGGGPQEAALRAQAGALGLQDVVHFAGRIAHDQVARYYRLIDLLVYPRLSMRLTELVTPLKPLEAMAQGILLLASDVGGHRELLGPAMADRLFRAGDAAALEQAIEDLLARRAQWPQLRLQARAQVSGGRSWAASAARYRAVYQGLLQAAVDTGRLAI